MKFIAFGIVLSYVAAHVSTVFDQKETDDDDTISLIALEFLKHNSKCSDCLPATFRASAFLTSLNCGHKRITFKDDRRQKLRDTKKEKKERNRGESKYKKRKREEKFY